VQPDPGDIDGVVSLSDCVDLVCCPSDLNLFS